MRLKALHQKNLVKAKNIIVDSVMDQLVPQFSSLKTPKEMFDFLTKIFEGKNIHQKMTLRNKIEEVKEEVKNAEAVITTLNGLQGSWDSFMRGMCARRKRLLSAESGNKKKLYS